MAIKRFDVGSWLDSPLSRRRLDLSQFAKERAAVVDICARVAAEGDAALREFGERFDGWAPRDGETFQVPPGDVAAAANRLAPADRSALEFAAQRIRDFHSRQVHTSSSGPPGLKLVTRPVRRAAVLAAAHITGVDAVYRIGGAQAIAALAYGTASIPRVDVVAGPGNIYVTLAKREVFGAVGVDGIAGPTEVMVIADAGARPDFVAADLAAQLEHDPLAWAVLVTDSSALANRVEEELRNLIIGLDRAPIINAATCCLIIADDLEQAIHLANDFAPEHLLIVAEDAGRLATQVENAGAIFVGAYATVPLGDYSAGPNHTLPTSGAALFASPLGVHTFLKRSSVLSLNRGDLEMLRDATVRLAALEGLTAHAHAVEVRLE